MGRRGNANCPWRTWRSRTRWVVCFVTKSRYCISGNGNVDDDLTQKFAVPVEYLNAMVSAVRYIDIVLCINSNAVRSVECTWLVSRLTSLCHRIASFISFGDS